MGTQQKTPQPFLREEEILARNPKIDFRIVRAHKALERELKKLGVKTKKPSYNLEPLLGRDRARFENQHNH